MSFKSYAITTRDDGSLEFSDPRPLVFSGRDGIIARFVRADPKRALEPWKLTPDELHAFAFPAPPSGKRALVFEETAAPLLELQWLQSIHGQSAARTEMLFSFAPLVVESAGLPLRVRPPDVNRTYAEELVLTGGALAPDDTWHWSKPHLSLGGVVLSKAPVPAASSA